MKIKSKFRPDLTDYRLYAQALADRLNEDGLHRMSMTDAVKVAIEQACKKVLPDVKIVPRRKRYVRLEF